MSFAQGWLLGCWRSRQAAVDSHVSQMSNRCKSVTMLAIEAREHTADIVTPASQYVSIRGAVRMSSCPERDLPVLFADNGGSASSLSRNILGAPGFYQVVVVLAFQLLL